MVAVVDRAVVLEVLEAAAGRVQAVRVVERHDRASVVAQEVGGTEVGEIGHACVSRNCSTAGLSGMAANEPVRVTAKAPQAVAKRSQASRRASSATNASSVAGVMPAPARPYNMPPTKASPAPVLSMAPTASTQ